MKVTSASYTVVTGDSYINGSRTTRDFRVGAAYNEWSGSGGLHPYINWDQATESRNCTTDENCYQDGTYRFDLEAGTYSFEARMSGVNTLGQTSAVLDNDQIRFTVVRAGTSAPSPTSVSINGPDAVAPNDGGAWSYNDDAPAGVTVTSSTWGYDYGTHNEEPIASNTTSVTYTPTAAGAIYVKLSYSNGQYRIVPKDVAVYGDCPNGEIICSQAALSPLTLGMAGEAFPNPTAGRVQYRSKTGEAVRVYNVLGALVLSRVAEGVGAAVEIDLTPYPTGLYVITEGANRRIIVKR